MLLNAITVCSTPIPKRTQAIIDSVEIPHNEYLSLAHIKSGNEELINEMIIKATKHPKTKLFFRY